jgi:chorismate synthase
MTLRFLTSGESHGPALVAVLEGMPAGLPISEEMIRSELQRRQQGFGSGPRMNIEKDRARLLSGVMGGLTTGAPIGVLIENKDHESWVGKEVVAYTAPRPGHADLNGVVKYGYKDIRNVLERASARETAARVAVGAICRSLLEQFDIVVGGYVTSIGTVRADLDSVPYPERFMKAKKSDVKCPDPQAAVAMQDEIQGIIDLKDTLGGVIEIVALNLPVGLGSHVHWDRRLDSRIGAAMLGVQAIKGVEIGPAFENAGLPGTKVHDPIILERGSLSRSSNNAGGLEGGMTNGEPLVVRAAMKPIATTLNPQDTVDLVEKKAVKTTYERSDYCPVPRAVPVLEAMVAYVLADALLEKLGGDSIDEITPRYQALRTNRLDDIEVLGGTHTFW